MRTDPDAVTLRRTAAFLGLTMITCAAVAFVFGVIMIAEGREGSGALTLAFGLVGMASGRFFWSAGCVVARNLEAVDAVREELVALRRHLESRS